MDAECRECGQAARLEFVFLQRFDVEAADGAVWICPRCRHTNHLPAIGYVRAVTSI